MSPIEISAHAKRNIVRQYGGGDDVKGFTQILTVLAFLAFAWWLAARSVHVSIWLNVAAVLLISLFNLRLFCLLHECGHGSLFRSRRLNRVFGFVLGVVAGMPQYVWSQRHSYHHAHNGDWEKYRGPYTTMSIDEYATMSNTKRFLYRGKCHIAVTPLIGFVYFIFNPRFTWLIGSIALLGHVVRGKILQPQLPLSVHAASFQTGYWRSWTQYWHMFWTNIAVIALWVFLTWAIGPLRFFVTYLIGITFAGSVGILVFTVQHNFRHSYASDTEHWDYDMGAIKGTSFLVLPGWLNWFTANIGYHHVHHLSSAIPNYRLVACHNEYQDLFTDVPRITLAQIPEALKYILWDDRAHRLVSVEEYRGRFSPHHGLIEA